MSPRAPLSDDELRRRGLDALARELGPADMARFLRHVRTTSVADRQQHPSAHVAQVDMQRLNGVPRTPDAESRDASTGESPLPSCATCAGLSGENGAHEPVPTAANRGTNCTSSAVPVSVDKDQTASRPRLLTRCLASRAFVLSGMVAAVVLLLLAFCLSQLPRQRVIRAVEAAGGEVYFSEDCPAWLSQIGGDWLTLESASEIRLDRTGVDDRFVQQLRWLNSANVVWLNGAQVTDQGAAVLLEFPNITSLDLADTRVTEATLVPLLRHNRQLDAIWLQGTAAGDASLEALGGTVTLTSLALARTRITDQGLAHLAGLPALSDLDLSDTAVGNAGLAWLEHNPGLSRLGLARTHVTGVGLEFLGRMPALSTLYLQGTSIQGSGLRFLRRLPDLNSLDLAHTPIGDDGLEHLAAMKSLRWVSLVDTRVTDAGLAKLAEAKQLGMIYLKGAAVTPDGISQLSQALPDCSIDVTSEDGELRSMF